MHCDSETDRVVGLVILIKITKFLRRKFLGDFNILEVIKVNEENRRIHQIFFPSILIKIGNKINKMIKLGSSALEIGNRKFYTLICKIKFSKTHGRSTIVILLSREIVSLARYLVEISGRHLAGNDLYYPALAESQTRN